MDPDAILRDIVGAAVQDEVAARERDLLERLNAPIFAQLMVERGMNPLGIEQWVLDSTVVSNWDDGQFRIDSRWLWMQQRPYPRELV